MTLFWRHGYDRVSIADLTDALNMAPPSLYAAFGSKERLFDEVLDHYTATRLDYIRKAIEEGPSARDAVAKILRECAKRYAVSEAPSGCLIGSAVIAPGSSNVGRILAERRNRSRLVLTHLFKAAQAKGEIAESVDAMALAHYYSAVAQGMSSQAVDGATPAQLAAVAEAAIAAWPSLAGATSRSESIRAS